RGSQAAVHLQPLWGVAEPGHPVRVDRRGLQLELPLHHRGALGGPEPEPGSALRPDRAAGADPRQRRPHPALHRGGGKVKSFRERNPYAIGLVSVLLIGALVGAAFMVGVLHLLERTYSAEAVFNDAAGMRSG